jgi:hypothetical protein
VKWVRSAAGDLRYVAWGAAWRPLAHHLQYLTGWRGRMERVALSSGLTQSGADRPVPTEAMQAAYSVRETLGSEGASSGLLLYTGYYKDSWFVGPIASDSQFTFVKIFRTPKQAEAEVDRAMGAERLAAGDSPFECIPARHLQPTSVMYPLVTRSRRSRQADAEKIGQWLASHRLEPAGESDLLSERSARAEASLYELVGASASRPGLLTPAVASVPYLVPTHGDVTPWNIVPTVGSLTLIDYDNVAPRPRCYDLIYALTHGPLIEGATVSPTRVKQRLAAAGVIDAHQAVVVAAALATSVLEHLESLQSHPENAARAIVLLRKKYRLLEAVAS